MQNHFRQSFESSPESRGSQTSGVLLVLFVQAKSTKNRSLLLGAPRFCKPRISPPKQQLRTNKIKSFPILFVRHKKYDKKAFAPFGAARSACIPPPSAALSLLLPQQFPPLRGLQKYARRAFPSGVKSQYKPCLLSCVNDNAEIGCF